MRRTLLAALCHVRKAEMIDGLVELLIQLVHKISVRDGRKAEKEVHAEFRRVHGKNGIAEAALDLPEELVRETIYPVVGTRTLRGVIAQAKATSECGPSCVAALCWTGRSGSGWARGRCGVVAGTIVQAGPRRSHRLPDTSTNTATRP